MWDHSKEALSAWKGNEGVDLTETFSWKEREGPFLLSPCAAGGVFESDVIEIQPGFVCGGANRIVTAGAVARKLHEKGCWVFPSILSSAGAVIQGMAGFISDGPSADALMRLNFQRGRALMARAIELDRSPWLLLNGLQPEELA